MTKEITKAIILQEITDKFNLRDFEPVPFLFSETVQPVYNIEKHVEHRISGFKQITVSGTGSNLFYTVPENERWHLRGYNVVFMTGVFAIAGIFLTRHTSPTDAIYLDLTPAQDVSYAINLVQLATLDPGDTLSANVDSFTSGGSMRLYIDYTKEEIR